MINKKKRILVVDDEESVTRMLKLNLEQTGEYEVHTENSATHVIHAVRDFHPDAICLDVLMPEVTGDYVAQQLRDIPSFRQIPIVFLTAIKPEPPGTPPPGKDPVIGKPVEISVLRRILDERIAVSESAGGASL